MFARMRAFVGGRLGWRNITFSCGLPPVKSMRVLTYDWVCTVTFGYPTTVMSSSAMYWVTASGKNLLEMVEERW